MPASSLSRPLFAARLERWFEFVLELGRPPSIQLTPAPLPSSAVLLLDAGVDPVDAEYAALLVRGGIPVVGAASTGSHLVLRWSRHPWQSTTLLV